MAVYVLQGVVLGKFCCLGERFEPHKGQGGANWLLADRWDQNKSIGGKILEMAYGLGKGRQFW